MKPVHKQWLIIGVMALIKLSTHLLTNTNYELHRDALLYYSLGEHLDWGFVSVPPFTPLMAKFSTLVFGNTVFGMRLLPALTGAASMVVIGRFIRALKGGNMALIIALTAFLFSPAFLRSNTLFQPVSFNQFFWLLSGYLILRLFQTQDTRMWLGVFLVWALAFLNKYSVTFFVVTSLVALIISQYRRFLGSRYFFLGGLLALVIILPNLIWQYSHNWPVIHHMMELQRYQLVHVTLPGFLVDQLVMNLPALLIWGAGLLVALFGKQEKELRFFGYLFLLVWLMLILLRGKSYYTLGLYSILFALGGYAIEKYYHRSIQYAVVGLAVILSLPMLPFSLPVMSHEKIAAYSRKTTPFTNRWEDGEIYAVPQDYADMTGWKELNRIVVQFYQGLSEQEQARCSIYAENYGQAGSVFFYGKTSGLPEPVSFSDNFLLWAPDTIMNESLIYINHELGDAERLFDSCRVVGQVNNPYFREDGLKVYYCTQPTERFQTFYAGKVSSLKERYRRDL